MKLSRSQLREIERQAKRQAADGTPTVVQFDYPAKKPGAYRLGKVLDEYKLEVQRRSPYTFVVPCPEARLRQSPSSGRCLGDLSDLSIQVDGTPPLKIVYSRMVNGKDRGFHFESLQPDGFSTPMLGALRSTSLIASDDEDISWARSRRVTVGVNESMHTGGEWEYSVNEVHDAFGNIVKYVTPAEDPDMKPRPNHLAQNFFVKERPRARLEGCDLRNSLRVAKGQSKALPVAIKLAGRTPDDTTHTLTWEFSPLDTLTKNGEHGDVVSIGSHVAKNTRDYPKISAPGLYTLKSVASGACEGEIEEPSSCLLLNPLEPTLALRSEDITDTCAGNPIGLRVDLDLVGTPPFIVRYDVISNGDARSERVQVHGMRTQLELIPRVAGNHKYIFKQISDDIYKGQPLTGSEYVLEQDVKPAASAMIQHSTGKLSACLEEAVEVDVLLLGEPPFTLEWELVHDGRRKQQRATSIEENSFKIKTAPLAQGGEYTLALTSVQDKRACRIFLQEEVKLSVRRQRPRAWFGLLENKRTVSAVEETKVNLPLRLTGDRPWKISYRNLNDESKILEKTLENDNGVLSVDKQGVFEILGVYDNQCQGDVDPNASRFEVNWFPRPELSLIPTESISENRGRYIKQDVCESDIDGFEIGLKGKTCFFLFALSFCNVRLESFLTDSFLGSAPYHVEYEVRHKPSQGTGSLSRKSFDAAFGKASIQMDTAKAGLYTYRFSSLADNRYDSDRRFQPLILEQTVNAKPSASFVKPGQSFKYCQSDAENEDSIPITLTGVAPFYVEIEIKHQTGSVPETYRIPSIDSNSYGIRIPRQHLKLGSQQVRIRKVKDARGCQQDTPTGGASVQVQLYEAPTIYPLEARTDYCVGERISYSLSGTPPFEVWYTFDGAQRKAKSPTTNFRRIAETPGEFTITTVSDKASECRAAVNIAKTIHAMPAVKISRGQNVQVDIHEGSEVDILFEFWGTPPFEFTYTRSTNERKGQKSQVLETRHDTSYEHSKVVRASQEGTYEVVAIKDKFCAFSTQQVESKDKSAKMLTY